MSGELLCPFGGATSCNERLGLFSRNEIVSKAKSLPDGEDFELHRPWIDRVIITCPKCGMDMKREPFVLDTWHNSGAAPYSAHTDKEYEDYIPMPFFTEGIDQSRGWAYSLLIENVILSMKAQSPYRAFLFMGHVLDENGEKLSKSKGNFVPVRELLKATSGRSRQTLSQLESKPDRFDKLQQGRDGHQALPDFEHPVPHARVLSSEREL